MINNKSTGHFTSLQWIAMVEGITLLLLIGIAVPLKHLAHIPLMVQLLGPIHGMTFILYLWSSVNTAAEENWSKKYLIKVCCAAFIPFGGFIVSRLVRKSANAKKELSI